MTIHGKEYIPTSSKCKDCSFEDFIEETLYCSAKDKFLLYSNVDRPDDVDCPLFDPRLSDTIVPECRICNKPATVILVVGGMAEYRCKLHFVHNSPVIIPLTTCTDPVSKIHEIQDNLNKKKKLKTKNFVKTITNTVLSVTEKSTLDLLVDKGEVLVSSLSKEEKGSLGRLNQYDLITFDSVKKFIASGMVRKYKTVKLKEY